ncbi:MAG: bifunctional diguanylate cyclase/phosphodiesterase [Burkholderiales bacterium]
MLAATRPVWHWLTTPLGVSAAIGAFSLALIVSMWAAVIVQTKSERDETVLSAIQQNSNLAMAFEEHTYRTIKGIDAATLLVVHEYARLGSKMDLSRYIADGLIDGRLFTNVTVADANGNLVLSSQALRAVNVADREHFQVHREHDSRRLFIGKPLLSRTYGRWSIPMSRRINKPDGSFGGVVSALVDPAYFMQFYQKTALGKDGVVDLVGLDGTSRARYAGPVSSFGNDMSRSTLLKEHTKSAVGSFLSVAGIEGVPRHMSFRTLPDYPLVVMVGASQREVLADYHRKRKHAYALTLLVSVVIVSFGALLIAAFGRQKRAIDALASSETQLRATFNQAAIGIAHTAPDGRFLKVNQKLCDMFGYTREELVSLKIADITHPEDRGTGKPLQSRLIAGEIETFSVERRGVRKDGSVIWTNRTVSLVRDAKGAPLYFIRVIDDITQRNQLQQDLQHLAHRDSLTQLPNRRLFYDRLEHALEQAKRRDWITGVMYVDVDRFKLVNDTLGHSAGDQLLQQAAARLVECVRAEDSVGRLGGDEFAVILSELAHPEDARLPAGRIIDAFGAPFRIGGNEVFITASIGISTCPPDNRDADALISHADAAMYEAKKAGKNNYRFYTVATNERQASELLIEKDLRTALMQNEFVLHYQPKANLKTGEITGVEALMRWQRADGRLVPPMQFIPLLEESGLIGAVGEWALGAACAQIRWWQEHGLTAVPVAVNLSAKQFQRQDIAEIIKRALTEHKVAPALLELEITETAAMHNAETTTNTLRKLKALGVRIAIDDFGTGYSSLGYLKRFPIDALKIDRSFITELPDDQEDASIAQAIITLSHALRLKVIAEGVENRAQLDFLAMHGCDEMQGYYFSRPLPADQCTQFLREARTLSLRSAAVSQSVALR